MDPEKLSDEYIHSWLMANHLDSLKSYIRAIDVWRYGLWEGYKSPRKMYGVAG
jgi:hypothetical protein